MKTAIAENQCATIFRWSVHAKYRKSRDLHQFLENFRERLTTTSPNPEKPPKMNKPNKEKVQKNRETNEKMNT